jgi:hypothetical protein
VRPATLLPYPEVSGRRPVALRPTLSGGLPFAGKMRCERPQPLEQEAYHSRLPAVRPMTRTLDETVTLLKQEDREKPAIRGKICPLHRTT